MSGLVRAEWLRIRRRWDVWIIVLGLPLLAAFGYVTGVASANNNGGVGFGNPGVILQDLAREEAMRALASMPYQFPRSIATIVQADWWLILAAGFLAASLIGNEFSWGTIRNVALFRADRLRYLAVRLVSVTGLMLVSFGLIVAVAAILPFVVHPAAADAAAIDRVAADDPWLAEQFHGSLSVGSALLAASPILVAAIAAIGLVGVFSILFRSASTGLLVAGVYAVVEGMLGNMAASDFAGTALAEPPRLMLTWRLTALGADAWAAATGTSAFYSGSVAPVAPAVGAVIVAAWLVGLFGLCFVLLRRTDIHE